MKSKKANQRLRKLNRGKKERGNDKNTHKKVGKDAEPKGSITDFSDDFDKLLGCG